MSLNPPTLCVYYVFVASPGDVPDERKAVRAFFERFNRTIAQLWNVRFEVIDWENYSTIGVGRPQELITKQTLERFHQSLALVVGIMWQRFGSPTGVAESGTEEEFNWALDARLQSGWPEIKWFFRKVEKLELPVDGAETALEQWRKVRAFRERLKNGTPPIYFAEYPSASGFRDVLEHDLNLWLAGGDRPWVRAMPAHTETKPIGVTAPSAYYDRVEREFHRLDIAGIDNDRTFEIPLSDIYVRLRVMFDEDAPDDTKAHDGGAIDIQTALLRYRRLVIVGDPGSGKSTFLKYIALMLARSFRTANPAIALEKLCLPEPLPLPIFVSCWDLADSLHKQKATNLAALAEFIAGRLTANDFSIGAADVIRLLESGNCCVMFDGLDEVPTDHAREAVSRLLEECVAKFGDNRYVVTSRIRAYTGDTILRGEFTRCDIQPFDASDRAEFIRNWVALLFKITPDQVEGRDGGARSEFVALTSGIEASDRIRPLAVNPLLLTVIAIVHWNRKRLPEQRVDLYDECVDVLLGQRKEAEHIQLARNISSLDERAEDQQREERAWVRKRFAEIALHVLLQDGDRDEAAKSDIVKLLTPRFTDRGASTVEQAAAQAERFLERQELRSGLLVSRKALSYRFVHLTFQEYLTAWHFSNLDFEKVTEIIAPRLRMAKWFETMQLLGGQWAKESDEKVERYVSWLLNQRGKTIAEKAPVVALCANVMKDISGIANVTPETRKTFRSAVEETLDAFRRGSGVDTKTQLEILDALARLGAAVKSHLIDATKAGQFPVRRRAIEMLLPHLSDDELFSLDHILSDPSKEPIKTYILAMYDRDETRFRRLLENRPSFGDRLCSAIIDVLAHNDRITWKRELLRDCAGKAEPYCRGFTLQSLVSTWRDESTRELLRERAVQDEEKYVRSVALQSLASTWPDESTRELLRERAVQDEDLNVRGAALQSLASTWPDESTRELLRERAVLDESEHVRGAACWDLGQMHSEFGRILPTRHLTGGWPYLDPRQPIPRDHIEQAATKAGIAASELESTLADLNRHLGWDVTRGAAARP